MCFVIITAFVFVVKICDASVIFLHLCPDHWLLAVIKMFKLFFIVCMFFIINSVTDFFYLSPDSVGVSQ
jgi:hypothetical protein